ncbi:MAG: class I tRNA ligase family protein [Nanoarchaeota archaeon]
MNKNNFQSIEKKWQNKWEKEKIFKPKSSGKKFYNLEMFPYPSGSGLHMGHALNYTIGDIQARIKRMQGFSVFYPMGYDSFGLPAENAAIQAKTHPKIYTEKAIKNFIKQQKSLGLSYDWDKLIKTSSKEYYKWNQYFFLKFLEKGLIYRKKSSVNWCNKCNTVLANEQVQNGKCWRHTENKVQIKLLEQWFIKTTKYAEELLNLDNLNWPNRIKSMQKNWIGKSHGTEILFEFENPDEKRKINCIIIHGCPSNVEKAMNPETRTYDKNWIPWIKKELTKRGINTTTPLMPEPWKSDYNKWKGEFEKLKINENSVLIGHSCGCSFLVRWLGETKKIVNKLILVAPAKITNKEDRKSFYEYTIDKTIKERVKDFIIFTADNEENRHRKSAKIFNEALDGKLIELKGRGHYVLDDMKTEEFPELLKEIISKEKWKIFTTRPDTIYGVSFMVISAQHQKLNQLVTKEQKKEVEKFFRKIKSVSKKDTIDLEKEGVFTGSYAINPLTKEKIPVYIGNFVVADYGSGMIMGVPSHDQRDFEFAKKYNISIKIVVQPEEFNLNIKNMTQAYTKNGILINSDIFNGLDNNKAKEEITKYLEKNNLGNQTIQYKLRDWLISRQRYWGTPIPIIYCNDCGIIPVPEKDLPIELPEKVKFGKGNPLETNKKFLNVKCPKCNKLSKRETDTMDTFFDSSWYFLRFIDSNNNKKPFETNLVNFWMPVDQYIGGAEHACMHLIYARFFTKALRDLNFLKFDEPFIKLFNQGMLHAEDGTKMSKSANNIIDPLKIIKKYSADSLRLFLVSVAGSDSDFNWSEKGILSSFKLINKIYETIKNKKSSKSSKRFQSKLHKSIKEITLDIENFKYNIAVIKIRELLEIFSEEETSKEDIENLIKLISPFCPHISEELWENLEKKNFVSLESWPIYSEELIDKDIEKQDQIISNTLSDINNIINLINEKQKKRAKKIYLYVIPNELLIFNENKISNKLNLPVKIFTVNDNNKYDPENKSKKAKPGKPGIYIE